ncbi:lytic transglycosylase domain-containing protein [Devosia limi]|uniref:Soluble lytic murein transglycosylase n=1 Tax=Devosia limi DSM 17137 TaxID=1121477 RepID=A0A1M4SEN1_9HYPH|nr:lytic transglycosylase domain-containing protein [Devosia limi]SHE30622.1 soluble lytic murein transglycosylase [Devosia limi DSM 17137]
MNGGLSAGLFAAVLGMASFAPLSHATTANDIIIDNTTTGAIGGARTDVSAVDSRGSLSFRNALDVLAGGDAAAAYEMARGLPNDTERRTIQWAAIFHHGGDINYLTVQRFAADAPNFAAPKIYKTRLEQSLTRSEPGKDEVIALLGGAMPNTVDAQVMLATAYVADGQKARAARLARDIWVDNFLTLDQEKLVSDTLGDLLDRDAHWARAVHLMMHDRATASERLIPKLTAAQKSLVVARAAVSRNDANAKKLLDSVDKSLQGHPVFIFSRAQRARQFELWDSAVDWLAKAQGELPDAAEWWYERRALVRALLNQGKPDLAYKAAAGYTAGPDGRVVEAQFHAGWIALSFLKDAQAAKGHFTKMAALSTLPDTITQSNYWLARANIDIGDSAAAQAAYQVAARYGTVYYGQLARAELGEAGVSIRPLPAWQQSETLFNSNEIVRAVRLLAGNGKGTLAVPLLRNFSTDLKTGGELLLAARLAQEIGAHHLAISIADTADRKGFALDLFSFPKDGLPANAQLKADRAAVFAVTRQESMFQADAISSAGARGLMQLMPGTAEETARKAGVDYSPNRLTSDPAYNALLGSTYLGAQLDRFGGSLLLAAAAYNAGPGNANKWIAAYGDPRADNVDPVLWVELIPFGETRKYVQRVLGNYLVYRERLGHKGMTMTEALRKIP